jgi:hypothetical protein
MAAVSIQTISSSTGSQTTYSAASAGGDTVNASGFSGVVLRIKNGSGASVTATLAGAVACNVGVTHSLAVTCPAGSDTEAYIPAYCINPTTGAVAITWSATTSVTFAAVDYVL